jgi:hypothetical protein
VLAATPMLARPAGRGRPARSARLPPGDAPRRHGSLYHARGEAAARARTCPAAGPRAQAGP